MRPDRLLAEINEDVVFLGDGADLYRDLIEATLKDKAHFVPIHLNYPHASSIAYLALKKMNGDTAAMTRGTVITPIYVRSPEVEIKRKKKIDY